MKDTDELSGEKRWKDHEKWGNLCGYAICLTPVTRVSLLEGKCQNSEEEVSELRIYCMTFILRDRGRIETSYPGDGQDSWRWIRTRSHPAHLEAPSSVLRAGLLALVWRQMLAKEALHPLTL